MSSGKLEKIVMQNRIADLSQRQVALIGGLGFLLMLVTSIFGKMVVPAMLIVTGDVVTTINNIVASEVLFRSGIVGSLLNYALDILIALVLYALLKPVNKSVALLGAWFRVVYSTIAGIAMLNHLFVLQLVSNANYSRLLEPEQYHALVELFLFGHDYGWVIGYLFFGLHLLIMGALAFKSGYMPRSLGFCMVWAGIGWSIHSLGHLLLPSYTENQTIVLTIAYSAAVGEFYLMGWLLWTGFKGQSRKNSALQDPLSLAT